MSDYPIEPSTIEDDFVDFLIYLHRKEDFDAYAIISVVEKPWKYKTEYKEFYKKNYGTSN